MLPRSMQFALTLLLPFFGCLYLGFLSPCQVSKFNIGDEFIPAGYMGCVDQVNMNPAWKISPYSTPMCFRIEFASSCPTGYAGVYWTNTADDSGANWGQSPGTHLSGKGYTKLTFWAKGAKGGEVVIFGFGGINNIKKEPKVFKYKDSTEKTYSSEGRTVMLETEWKSYKIDLSEKD